MVEDAGSGSVPANELRQVQHLLWNIIATKLNAAEVDEVRPPPAARRRHPPAHFLISPRMWCPDLDTTHGTDKGPRSKPRYAHRLRASWLSRSKLRIETARAPSPRVVESRLVSSRVVPIHQSTHSPRKPRETNVVAARLPSHPSWIDPR
jgi:hypothetical protein